MHRERVQRVKSPVAALIDPMLATRWRVRAVHHHSTGKPRPPHIELNTTETHIFRLAFHR